MLSHSELNAHLARLVRSVTNVEFPDDLVHMLNALANVDDATIILFDGDESPSIQFSLALNENHKSTLGEYVNGTFRLDPYYKRGVNKDFGLFSKEEVFPADFTESAYFESWYQHSSFTDECGYVISLSDDRFLNIALGRTGSHEKFTEEQLLQLSVVLPTVTALCEKHWSNSESAADGEKTASETGESLDLSGQ